MAKYRPNSNRDKGYGIKKRNRNGTINKKWRAIHYGTRAPRGAQDCGEDFPHHISDILDHDDNN